MWYEHNTIRQIDKLHVVSLHSFPEKNRNRKLSFFNQNNETNPHEIESNIDINT